MGQPPVAPINHQLMTLQKLAEQRMVSGHAAHPNETFEELSDKYLRSAAQEELADCWNYVWKHPNRNVIRGLLKIIWFYLK